MPDTLQFVDSISASPAVRLDLNDDVNWGLNYDGTDFSPPELRRAVSQTLLADGGTVTAAAYDLRVVRLRLDLVDTSPDTVAARMQLLRRELDRPTNLLRWQPGTTAPQFFLTMRSAINRVTEVPGPGTLKQLDVEVLAQPFLVGLKETLPQVTVYADPAEGTTLNANPYFETDATSWTALGATVARSTAQSYEGSASLLLTPDGVTVSVEARAENVPAVVGQQYRVSAWVFCAVARNVSIAIIWRDSGGALLTSSFTGVAVAAMTWTLLDFTATAPADTAFAQLSVGMGSTPPSSNTLYIDEARLRLAGGAGGCCFDVSDIKGDVETPLHLSLDDGLTLSRTLLFAVRRRGTPSQAPFVLQAEAMTRNSDTTLAASNDTAMSGGGQNYVRVPFGTTTAMVNRVSISTWPATPGLDVRGQYKVYARVRRNTGTDRISLRLAYAAAAGLLFADTVSLPTAAVTDPIYIDLGVVQLPAGTDPVTDSTGVELPAAGQYIAVQASRDSGSGTLDIDCLLFVPADDRLLIVKLPADAGLGATSQVIDGDRSLVYTVGPSGELLSLLPAETAGGPPMVTPGQPARIVMFSVAQTLENLTTARKVTPFYMPRYLYARPPSS